MIKASCKLHPDQILSEIDPLLFGNFIEFTHDCINEGLWAQMLHNRGFETAGPDGLVAEGWLKTGYNDSGLYSLDTETPFQKGRSQRIQLVHHFGGYKGICQNHLLLEAGMTYPLSFWARCDHKLSLTLRLTDGAGRLLWTERTELSPEKWTLYTMTTRPSAGSEEASLELLLEEEGTVWLDQCSFMPADAVDGVWKRVFEATAASHPTVMRFPGGCFADCYDWMDGIGPRDARPAKENKHWGGMEDNSFGTDEFLKFCRNLGCEPMICVNFGSAGPEDAARWVEYCNGAADTPMGKLRCENGHPEPYGVKYWGLGNETWADWEIGNLTESQYSGAYHLFSGAMREADPKIQLIACAGDGNSASQEWNRVVLDGVGEQTEYLDLHFYAPQLHETPASQAQIYDATVYAPHKYEGIIKETACLIKERGLPVRLMVGEYNAMYYNDSNREHTLETALFNAGLLNVFLRNGEMVRIGIFSDLVNGWQGGCIRSSRGRVCLTPSYHALCLYAGAGLTHAIACETDCPHRDIQGAGHVPPMEALPIVDSAACLGEKGEPCLLLVNRDPDQEAEITVSAEGYALYSLEIIQGEHPWSRNAFGGDEVSVIHRTVEEGFGLTMPPHSVCLAKFRRKPFAERCGKERSHK